MMNRVTCHPSRSAWLVIGCLVFVVVSDGLLYRQPRGVSVPLTELGLLALLCWRHGNRLARTPEWLLAGAIAGLLVAQTLHGSVLAVFMTALGLVTFATGCRQGWSKDAVFWWRRWNIFARQLFLKPFQDMALVQRWRQHHGRGAITVTDQTLLRVSIPILLGALFLALFYAANPILAGWLQRIGATLKALIRLPPLTRCLFWLVSAVLAWSLCRVRCRRRRAKPLPPLARHTPPPLPALQAAPPPVAGEPLLTAQVLMASLIGFNLLFALQNTLDARYLWCGASLPQGMTWAGYAHRGAYPLVVTALLAAVFILWAFHPAQQAGDAPGPRRWVIVWVAQNVFLTLSAAWRLNLYVQVYSLTLWRVAAACWMLLVALGLVWILVRILRHNSNTWLINVNAYTLAVVLYAYVFVDWEGVIAGYNMRHCREAHCEGPELDISYLQSLGSGTLPALYAFRDRMAAEHRGRVSPDLNRAITQLEAEFRDQTSNWCGWTWQRHRIQTVAASARTLSPGGAR